MTTLTKLCLESLANSICNAPPVIQEMVVDNVITKIKKKKKQDIQTKTTNDICDMNTTLIPDIVNYISDRNYNIPFDTFSRIKIQTRFKYCTDPFVLDTAIDIAESVAMFYKIKDVGYNLNYMDDESSDEGDY